MVVGIGLFILTKVRERTPFKCLSLYIYACIWFGQRPLHTYVVCYRYADFRAHKQGGNALSLFLKGAQN